MSLVKRSIYSVSWNVFSNFAGLGILFLRSVYLARLLPVDTFGTYALASAVIRLTVIIPTWGMGTAFLHRTTETEDVAEAAPVHLTLSLLFTSVWAAALLLGAVVFTEGQAKTTMFVLTFAIGGMQLMQTPRLIMIRRVEHRRLALIKASNTVLVTAVAIGLAMRGATIWALLATDLTALALSFIFLYAWRPVWRPRLAWSRPIVRYFLSFGSRSFLASILQRALDRLDDLWVGFFLGQTSLGFYSRAYSFATYPRQVLAAPINTVAGGTYAELKGDRLRLSKAFFRTNALLVRTGFLFAGTLALIAPELVVLLLTEKWLPMLTAFRLMLIFALFDPIKITVSNAFMAVGRPDQVVKARVIQLVVLGVGLFAFGTRLDIAGVALAIDVMLIVGVVILLMQVGEHVDFSMRRLFLAPLTAFALGFILTWTVLQLFVNTDSAWITALVKIVTFLVTYSLVLLILERKQTTKMLEVVINLIRNRSLDKLAQ